MIYSFDGKCYYFCIKTNEIQFIRTNFSVFAVVCSPRVLDLNVFMLPAVKFIAPTLTHVIPSQDRGSVYAMTSLDDDVFVIREGSQQIEVYDAATFALRRHITVPGLGSRSDGIAACARNRCLYLSDDENDEVRRIALSVSRIKLVKSWSVASKPTGLSVNSTFHLVVACYGADKLQEYTTRGSLVREIILPPDVTSPWHAVQLSSGDYVISRYTSEGEVNVVRVDGQVVQSYGQSQTSDVEAMNHPTNLAVASTDDILVADKGNDGRILSINRSSGAVRELPLSADGGIQLPRGLCLDESRGRLYVGECLGDHRILVFDVTATL